MTKTQEKEQAELLTLAHHTYHGALSSYAFYKVSDYSVGEDLVQDTFLKTWKYLLRGGKITLMKSFLYHILNDLIVDSYRKKSASLDVLIESGYELGVDETERLYNFSDGGLAFALLKKLPLPYKRIVRMRFVQDLSLREMALITGQTRNTVAVQVHRGMEKLRTLYNHQGEIINTNLI